MIVAWLVAFVIIAAGAVKTSVRNRTHGGNLGIAVSDSEIVKSKSR